MPWPSLKVNKDGPSAQLDLLGWPTNSSLSFDLHLFISKEKLWALLLSSRSQWIMAVTLWLMRFSFMYLEQVYQVAYVVVKSAISPRPGNWILERSVDGVTFLPWQYYALSDGECLARYGSILIIYYISYKETYCSCLGKGTHKKIRKASINYIFVL